MVLEINVSRKTKVIAGIITIVYILIQVFQTYVINHLPSTHSLTDELLQGSENLNIWRALLLLLSFFGLIYMFFVICSYNLRYRFIPTIYAFIGFTFFCFSELFLRSIELFYIQIHLPQLFKMTTDINEQKTLLTIFTNFQSIQYALYFPLMLFPAIASFVLAFNFNRTHNINYLIISALTFNGIRTILRIIGMYLNINIFDFLVGNMYVVFVVLIFGPIAFWLLKVKE